MREKLCGIIGVTQRSYGLLGRNIGFLIGRSLKRLEYRGYDSVGFAVLDKDNKIFISKAKGKIDDLYERLGFEKYDGLCGIGHTRWATHGSVNDVNAHPHTDCSGCIAVVHNGVIQNYDILRRSLENEGHRIISETDTELVAHLLEKYLDTFSGNMLRALRELLMAITGTYALAILYCREPGRIYFAKHVSPLIIGLGDGFNVISSDIPAIIDYTKRIIVLEDGEYGYLTPNEVYIENINGEIIDIRKRIRFIEWDLKDVERGGYSHYMLKEIYEQPYSIEQSLAGISDQIRDILDLFSRSNRIFITGAGSSYHAGLVLDYALKRYLGLLSVAFISSEAELYKKIFNEKDLLIAISQSGETIDTLKAIRIAKSRGTTVLAISNVIDSTIPRESDYRIYMRAGPEIGVAATKTFTTQVAVGLYLVYKLLERYDSAKASRYLKELITIPHIMSNVLGNLDSEARELVGRLKNKNSMYILGRDISYPVSLEGALKIKEISYIHAEAYPAGESKHGPIALVEKDFPVFFTVFDKEEGVELILGNIEEMRARGAYVVSVAPRDFERVHRLSHYVFKLPRLQEINASILYVVPYQLLAYHLAIEQGYDPDKPRNLAKTVTVE